MNKKQCFLFIGDSKGRKYFTMNKFHMKISNGEFFLNYGNIVYDLIHVMISQLKITESYTCVDESSMDD